VRGFDPINGRVRRAAWAGLLLLATATARAQAPADGYAATRPGEPVDLCGDRVLTWDAGDRHWAILDGDAAALQRTEGLRAARAVVRYGPDPAAPGVDLVEVYAEGLVPPAGKRKGRASGRKTFRAAGVRLRPYASARVQKLAGPPARGPGALLLGSAFPRPSLVAHVAASSTPIAAPHAAVGVTTPPTEAGMQPGAAAGSAPILAAEGPAVTLGEPVPEAAPKPRPARVIRSASAAPPDAELIRTQFEGDGFGDPPGMPAPPGNDGAGEPAAAPAPEAAPAPAAGAEPLAPAAGNPLAPPPGPAEGAGDLLNAPGIDTLPPLEAAPGVAPDPAAPAEPDPLNLPNVSPILPGSQRTVTAGPRNGGTFGFKSLPTSTDGTETVILTGGVNVVINSPAPRGTTDISADTVVIWYRNKNKGRKGPAASATGPVPPQDEDEPLEFYMEGNVVVRIDERTIAGNSDQKTYLAAQAYHDSRLKRFYALDAELDEWAPGLVAPLRVKTPRMQQFTDLLPDKRGRLLPTGPSLIRADKTTSSGSRFATPGYRFDSLVLEIRETPELLRNPITGKVVPPGPNGVQPMGTDKKIEARQNLFFVGPVPVFYWPRLLLDPDDPTPPLQNIRYFYNNYLGNLILADFNGFKLFNLRKPKGTPRFNVDVWNVDIDYLSLRGPALGTEFAFFGETLIPNTYSPYFSYLNIWGLVDHHFDVLGTGPAIVTDSPNPLAGVFANRPFGPGRARFDRSAVPPYTSLRGKVDYRLMTNILPEDHADDEDARVQLEFGYLSDRHFLEEYYKRLFDTGLDEETLVYGIRQRQNHALTAHVEGNLQNFYTDTEWLPKLSYYRLGDSLLGDRLTYFTNSGVDYARTHTAIEVGNPNVFAFLPTDPVSNTGRAGLQTGRAWTTHELDLPVQLGALKVTPYLQGQAMGWDNQLGNVPVGRLWGAAGARASLIAWRVYQGAWTENELLNIHGLNHKIQFDVDGRFARSNVNLDRIGIQDDLDDNTYEFVRRYFAMSQFANAALPPQYDPRHLLLRRAISPITGTPDVQASVDTVQFGVHQRLQTRRGPEGRRRIVDYMVLDATTTYFPNPTRDNFNKPFGQTMYNYEWFLGDRTSITSYGWFEFFDITGGVPLYTEGNPHHANNPFSFAVVTAGVNMQRPPRANLYVGYSIIDTGPINTSALLLSYGYLLSPKWYSTFSTMYDFGNKRLLGATFSFTKIGADFLTSVGITADPQRQNVQAGFQITPRISPNIRLGSSGGMPQFDTRYSPTQ